MLGQKDDETQDVTAMSQGKSYDKRVGRMW